MIIKNNETMKPIHTETIIAESGSSYPDGDIAWFVTETSQLAVHINGRRYE